MTPKQAHWMNVEWGNVAPLRLVLCYKNKITKNGRRELLLASFAELDAWFHRTTKTSIQQEHLASTRPDILPLCPCPRGRISPNTNRCVFPITVPFFCCSLPLYDFNSFTIYSHSYAVKHTTLPMMFRQRLHSSSMLRLESILSNTSQISSVTNIDANSLFHFQKESEDNEERRSPRCGSSWN